MEPVIMHFINIKFQNKTCNTNKVSLHNNLRETGYQKNIQH